MFRISDLAVLTITGFNAVIRDAAEYRIRKKARSWNIGKKIKTS